MKVLLYGHNFGGDEAVQKKSCFELTEGICKLQQEIIATHWKKNKGNFVENLSMQLGVYL
jgi:hypothetical protein